METSIVINLDNDEFQESLQGLSDILRGIASDIDFGDLPMDTKWIMDSNGNKVGTWKLGKKVSLNPWAVRGPK